MVNVAHIFPVNRGSDKTALLAWTDEAGLPLNMSGRSIEVFEASDPLAGSISVQWTNAALGEAELRFVWFDACATGLSQSFRIRHFIAGTPALDRDSSPAIWVDVQ